MRMPIGSAWLGGSARIPFVAGLDHYLPAALGRLHRRYATPYVALIVHGMLSCLFVAMSFVGATVEQAYRTMLLLAVVLQLVPFLYMYAALVRLDGIVSPSILEPIRKIRAITEARLLHLGHG